MRQLCILAMLAGAIVTAQPLTGRLNELVQAAPLDRAHVGLAVVDLDTGRLVYQHQAHAGFTPASNTKLFSGAFALATLGSGYRFTTRVVAPAAPDAHGLIRGDLVLVGGGDPTLSARPYPFTSCQARGNGYASLQQLAEAIVARGITRIDGDIVGDDTRYPYEPYAPDWTIDDASSADGEAAVSALMVNDNAPRGRDLARQGALDPAWHAAEQLRLAMIERGISIHGAARARHRAPAAAWQQVQGVELARRISPPFGEILMALEKCSINLHAETVMLEAALKLYGTLADRDQALRARAAFLQQLGVPLEETELYDGSGLGRANLVSPAAVTALLAAVHRAPWGAELRRALPVGGVDGTLEHRFAGDAHAREIQAKTGTLRHVSALSGYAGHYAFALLVTQYFASDKVAVLQALDRIGLAIAEARD